MRKASCVSISLLLAVALLGCDASGAEPHSSPSIERSGTHHAVGCRFLGTLDSGIEAADGNISVVLHVYDRASCVLSPPGIYFSGDDAAVSTYIGKVSLVVRGEEVFVPLSAYSDLDDPGSVAIVVSPNRDVVIHIEGRKDGAWTAEWTITEGLLVKRSAWLREFPEARDETIYRFPPDL